MSGAAEGEPGAWVVPAGRAAALEGLAARVRGAFEAARASFDLAAIVEGALPPLPPKRAEVRVIAAGKAAAAMMAGALRRWPERVGRGLVVTVEGGARGAGGAAWGERVEVIEAAHPVPDERSARAAEAALAMARGLTKADLLLVLVSGGASSLLCAAPEGMRLDDKRALVRELVASGASIRDINLVRRHASRIKGGRLAAAAGSARVMTLAVSDVIGGALHDIGSGPSVEDPTTLAEARDALARFAPAWAARAEAARVAGRAWLTESLKLADAPRMRARIVAGPEAFAEHVASALRAGGLGADVRVLPAEEGPAEEVAERRLRQARSLGLGGVAVVPCEPTLSIPARHGRGGRSGWLALRALGELPGDVALLCGATDGADGASGSSGAIVTAAARGRVDRAAIAAALEAFDDAPLHAALGTRLEGGATGLNFADVHVVARLG